MNVEGIIEAMSVFTKQSDEEKRRKVDDLAERMTKARIAGGLYHPTNHPETWMCEQCGVFGRGGTKCWACDSTDIEFQIIPRFGGGVQTTGPFEDT